MSFARRLNQTVTVLTAASKQDRYGNTVVDWANATSRTVKVWVAQTGSTEELLGRDSTTTVAVVFFPAGDPITAADRVQVDGVTYEVNGVPDAANNGRSGAVHHIQVRLKDVEG